MTAREHWEGVYGRNAATSVSWFTPHLAESLRYGPRLRTFFFNHRRWRGLTCDQRKELTRHKDLTARTGVAVYFCGPQSPWQRGTC